MTSKLIPSNPSEVMVIRKLTENITTLSAPFLRFGHIKVGGRGTLVKLPSGGVAVFSPVALTPEVKETVSALGELKYIAALDIEVHIPSQHFLMKKHFLTTRIASHFPRSLEQRVPQRKSSRPRRAP
jgi:hypothetical protein